MNDPLELLTVAEVAGLMKRPRAFVLGLIREGKLPVVRLGDKPFSPHTRGRKDYRLSRDAVAAFLRARAVAMTPVPVVARVRQPRPPLAVPPCWDGICRTAYKRPKKGASHA
jgi:excisionase family DNA binding protein